MQSPFHGRGAAGWTPVVSNGSVLLMMASEMKRLRLHNRSSSMSAGGLIQADQEMLVPGCSMGG